MKWNSYMLHKIKASTKAMLQVSIKEQQMFLQDLQPCLNKSSTKGRKMMIFFEKNRLMKEIKLLNKRSQNIQNQFVPKLKLMKT